MTPLEGDVSGVPRSPSGSYSKLLTRYDGRLCWCCPRTPLLRNFGRSGKFFILGYDADVISRSERWAGVPQRRCWSGLSAISLAYRRRDELSASGAARACAMGGAPVRECGGVDVNTQHDVSIGLEPLLHFLGHLQPFFPARWHLVAIVEKLQQRWIIFLLDPIGPDCGRRFILRIRHACSLCRIETLPLQSRGRRRHPRDADGGVGM